MYSRGLRNLWIQTDSWLIRPWIRCCPQTSGGETHSSSPGTDFSSWVGDLSWSPDRLTFGPEVPVLHFTQRSVLTFFELDKVLCILKHSGNPHYYGRIFRDGDTLKHFLMNNHVWENDKLSFDTFKSKPQSLKSSEQLKTFAMDSCPERFPLLHHTLKGNFTHWVQALVMSVSNRLADISNYTCHSLYKCKFCLQTPQQQIMRANFKAWTVMYIEAVPLDTLLHW